MKICIKEEYLIWKIIALLFITDSVLIWLQGGYLDPDGGKLNPLILLLSYPWFWIAEAFDLSFPYVEPIGYFNVVFITWILNILLIVFFRKLFRIRKINLFNSKTLMLLWGINFFIFIAGLVLDPLAGLADITIVEIITYPWCLLKMFSYGFLVHLLPIKNSVYLSFPINSVILGVLTLIYVIKKLRIKSKQANDH